MTEKKINFDGEKITHTAKGDKVTLWFTLGRGWDQEIEKLNLTLVCYEEEADKLRKKLGIEQKNDKVLFELKSVEKHE